MIFEDVLTAVDNDNFWQIVSDYFSRPLSQEEQDQVACYAQVRLPGSIEELKNSPKYSQYSNDPRRLDFIQRVAQKLRQLSRTVAALQQSVSALEARLAARVPSVDVSSQVPEPEPQEQYQI